MHLPQTPTLPTPSTYFIFAKPLLYLLHTRSRIYFRGVWIVATYSFFFNYLLALKAGLHFMVFFFTYSGIAANIIIPRQPYPMGDGTFIEN
jgi:hypothetical protein